MMRDDATLFCQFPSMPYLAKNPCVYILACQRNGTLYIGVTSDLPQRISLHKQDLIDTDSG
jgi:hypothetical protein